MEGFERTLLAAIATNDAALHAIFGTPSRLSYGTARARWLLGAEHPTYDRIGSIWRHLAKDWSTPGAAGRAELISKVVDVLASEQKHALASGDALGKILVPGCGQARLAAELAASQPQSEVLGLEQSPLQLAVARCKIGPAPLSQESSREMPPNPRA